MRFYDDFTVLIFEDRLKKKISFVSLL